jgi:hypothetical protein
MKNKVFEGNRMSKLANKITLIIMKRSGDIIPQTTFISQLKTVK